MNVPHQIAGKRAAGTRRAILPLALILLLALAYAVIAATQHAGSWTIFAFDDRVQNSSDGKHVDVSGNDNVIEGDVKSNGDFHNSGEDNDFDGLVRYYDDVVSGTGSGNTYIGGEPQQEAFSGWPGNLATFVEPDCDFGTRTTNSDLDLEEDDPPGVYCRGNGKVVVKDAGSGTGQFTILTNGEINVGDEGVDLIPHTDGILFYSANNLIDWSGNLGSAQGLIFAPEDIIKIQGNENEFCAQFASETFQLSGNENIFGECLAPTPTPTLAATPTPTPTLAATPTPTPTLAATPTPTPTLAATPTPTPTLAATPTPTPTLAATPTPTPTLAATPTPTPTLAATPTPTPTLAATPTPTPTLAATPTPTPTLAATPTPTPAATPPDTGEVPSIPGPGSQGDMVFLLILAGTLVAGWLFIRPVRRRA